MKAHGGTDGGRSQGVVRSLTTSGGERRVEDEETERPNNTEGPGDRGGDAATSIRGGACVPED